ncbi:MAG: galactose-1-phosphate uridylyltransferase, partial [Chloroflexota bacterium]
MFESPHRRFNPLTREWVLVSPHRSKRPWLGQVEKTAAADLPAYDPACYLCPGNERAGGIHNTEYSGTYVFENDFASLLPDLPENPDEFSLKSAGDAQAAPGNLLIAAAEQGLC